MNEPTGLQDRLIRHRAWVVMGVLVAALIVVGVVGIGRKARGGTSATRPRVAFGSGVGRPPSASILDYTNGWVVGAGTDAVAVYAGSQAAHPSNGMLVIALTAGSHRRLRSLVVRDSGPITLLRPPTVDSEQAAGQATLHFVTANGDTGSLGLDRDQLSLSS